MEIIKRGAKMEMKRISISSKRQLTIPQKFFETLGFGTEAECSIRGEELIIRPVRVQASGEFDEFILRDLISQGIGGEELLSRFIEERRKIRPAVEAMIAEADELAKHGEPVDIEKFFGEG